MSKNDLENLLTLNFQNRHRPQILLLTLIFFMKCQDTYQIFSIFSRISVILFTRSFIRSILLPYPLLHHQNYLILRDWR